VANAGTDGRGIAILAGDAVAGRPGIHVVMLLRPEGLVPRSI
jgi:hypothetical protein